MIIPGSEIELDTPSYQGTPDEWFEQATQITRQQAAERIDDSWYISRTNSGYMLQQANAKSNEARMSSLYESACTSVNGKKFASARIRVDDPLVVSYLEEVDPTTRILMIVNSEPPSWSQEDLLMADSAPGSTERVLWSANSAKTTWRQVRDGRKNVSPVEMADLNPNPVSITEL